MKNALTICFALCCLKAWHRSVQFPVHISRRGGEELDKRSNPENREEPNDLKIEIFQYLLAGFKKAALPLQCRDRYPSCSPA